jgi:hypothetical protein
VGEGTHVVLGNQGEELPERGLEVSTQSVGDGCNEVSSRRDQDRVVFGLVLGGHILIVLVGILLANSLLLENLDGDVANGFKV